MNAAALLGRTDTLARPAATGFGTSATDGTTATAFADVVAGLTTGAGDEGEDPESAALDLTLSTAPAGDPEPQHFIAAAPPIAAPALPREEVPSFMDAKPGDLLAVEAAAAQPAAAAPLAQAVVPVDPSPAVADASAVRAVPVAGEVRVHDITSAPRADAAAVAASPVRATEQQGAAPIPAQSSALTPGQALTAAGPLTLTAVALRGGSFSIAPSSPRLGGVAPATVGEADQTAVPAVRLAPLTAGGQQLIAPPVPAVIPGLNPDAPERGQALIAPAPTIPTDTRAPALRVPAEGAPTSALVTTTALPAAAFASPQPAPAAQLAHAPAAPTAVTADPQAPAHVVAAPTQSSPVDAPATVQAPAPAGTVRHAITPQVHAPVMAIAKAGDGEHTLTLKVTPESLGSVTVKAHIAGGQVRIELISATDAGRDALRGILTDLRRDLTAIAPASTLTLATGDTSTGSQNQGGQSSAFSGNAGGGTGHTAREAAHGGERRGPAAEREPAAPQSPTPAPAPQGVDLFA